MTDFEYVALEDDLGHYERVFKAFLDHKYPKNSREAWIPMVLQHENIQTSISGLEQSGGSMRVLGIGSGNGVEDRKLISGVLEMYPKIHSTVVEPNKNYIRKYQETVASMGNLQKADWDWRQQTWDDYLTFRKETNDSSKFHVITSIHSIYYMQGGVDAAVDGILDCLQDGGVLIVCLSDKDNGFREMVNWPWNRHHKENMYDTPAVMKSLERRGFLCERSAISEFCDVTDCVERKNESDARHLEDFITHVVNFKERAPSNIYDDFVKRLHEPRITFRENGRICIALGCDIIIARKE